MNAFFEMGGYAAFVWPAYGISALVLGLLTYSILRRRAKAKAALEQLTGRKAGSASRAQSESPSPETKH